MVTVLVPHVGGPILPPGAPTVLIGGLPAATVTSMCTCVGPPDVIIMGSTGVLINFLPAARIGDPTAHGGVIILGCPTVMIGEVGSPSPGAAGAAAVSSGLAATGHDNAINANKSVYATAGASILLAKGALGHKHVHTAQKHPCSGKGMATPKNEQEFAKGMKQVQADWPKLTPDERKEALTKLANQQLSKGGAPPVELVRDNDLIGTTTMGFMDPSTGNITINPDLMNSASMSNSQASDLGDTIYHETRHSEQLYLVARSLAGEGETASEINQKFGIPNSFSSTGAKHPMKHDDPLKPCAQKIFDSLYGKNSAHRENVLTQEPLAEKALDAARSKAKAISSDPTSTMADKAAAEVDEQKALSIYKTYYNQYKNLPEEADAWQTGEAVGKLLRN
jgi:uncharacterized Zn-binding protein involved in type VI secretion